MIHVRSEKLGLTTKWFA